MLLALTFSLVPRPGDALFRFDGRGTRRPIRSQLGVSKYKRESFSLFWVAADPSVKTQQHPCSYRSSSSFGFIGGYRSSYLAPSSFYTLSKDRYGQQRKRHGTSLRDTTNTEAVLAYFYRGEAKLSTTVLGKVLKTLKTKIIMQRSCLSTCHICDEFICSLKLWLEHKKKTFNHEFDMTDLIARQTVASFFWSDVILINYANVMFC